MANRIILTAGPVGLDAGTPVSDASGLPVAISQATPGTTNYVENRANCRRNAGILHRSAATATGDHLAVPTVSAASAVTESGSNLANSAMNYTACAYNRWGTTTGAAVQAITPTANQAIRIPIAQVTGADGYDIFLSTAAAPLWVARITEAQRAAGGFIVSAVGTVTAGGGAGAGAVDIGIQGTGLAWNVNPFAVNTALTPASITPISCVGYTLALVQYKVNVTDLRSLPALTIGVMIQNQTSTGDWHNNTASAPALLQNTSNPLEQIMTSTVSGAAAIVVVIQTLSGQGATVDVWVDLV